MKEAPQKKLLICPLDWGIGHATRCVPVIRKFLEAGYSVTIAADNRPYAFLRKEFPELKMIRFSGQPVVYRKKLSFSLTLLFQLPGLIRGYFREYRQLRKLIMEENPDIIVSDNRYGVWNRKVYSVIMTHQLEVMLPRSSDILSPMVNRIIRSLIKNFDECWIPDFKPHNGLAGKLSHPDNFKLPVQYIGTLSRFSAMNGTADFFLPVLFDLLILLSGPEPQRTILEEKLFFQLRDSGLKAIIVRGLTEQNEAFDLTEHIRVYSHLDTPSLKECILQSELVICRSGYSSIMDLVTLGKKAILIPTPGQTEQEYLAKYLMDKKVFFSIPQENFDLLYAIEMTRNFPGMVLRNDHKALQERIYELTAGILEKDSLKSPTA